MNAHPTHPSAAEREEMARLLPVPAERDLPGGRHRLLKEFLMTEIHHATPGPSLAAARSLRTQIRMTL